MSLSILVFRFRTDSIVNAFQSVIVFCVCDCLYRGRYIVDDGLLSVVSGPNFGLYLVADRRTDRLVPG